MVEFTTEMGDVASATRPIQKGRRMESGFMKNMKESGDKKMKSKKPMFSKKSMKSKKSGSRSMKAPLD